MPVVILAWHWHDETEAFLTSSTCLMLFESQNISSSQNFSKKLNWSVWKKVQSPKLVSKICFICSHMKCDSFQTQRKKEHVFIALDSFPVMHQPNYLWKFLQWLTMFARIPSLSNHAREQFQAVSALLFFLRRGSYYWGSFRSDREHNWKDVDQALSGRDVQRLP